MPYIITTDHESRHAVATLDEARAVLDETMIEVSRVDWQELREAIGPVRTLAAWNGHRSPDGMALIDAFNG